MSHPTDNNTAFSPELCETASGDKIILFTPGAGTEVRFEADVIKNEFGLYGLGANVPSEKYPNWVEVNMSVDQDFVKALKFKILIPSHLTQYVNGGARSFSHFAIAYEGGAHVLAAKLEIVKQWYYNIDSPLSPL